MWKSVPHLSNLVQQIAPVASLPSPGPPVPSPLTPCLEIQETHGVFCSQDRELAREWHVKLKLEEELVEALVDILSQCLLTDAYVPASEDEPSDETLNALADLATVVDMNLSEKLAAAVVNLEESQIVTARAQERLDLARPLFALRTHAYTREWGEVQTWLADLTLQAATTVPMLRDEIRAFEILLARHVLFAPLMAALEENQVVGEVGEIVPERVNLESLYASRSRSLVHPDLLALDLLLHPASRPPLPPPHRLARQRYSRAGRLRPRRPGPA